MKFLFLLHQGLLVCAAHFHISASSNKISSKETELFQERKELVHKPIRYLSNGIYNSDEVTKRILRNQYLKYLIFLAYNSSLITQTMKTELFDSLSKVRDDSDLYDQTLRVIFGPYTQMP